MKNKIISFERFFLLLFCLFGINTFSQTDCAKNLKRAKEFYAEGNIEKMDELLSGCIEEGFNREEKIEARKLLVLAGLFDDDLDSADEQMEEFLKLDPEYQIEKGKDQIEFIKLYETFKTTPSYCIGVNGGGNYSMVNNNSSVNVFPSLNSSTNYHSLLGFYIGLRFKKQFSKHFSADMSLNYSSLTFQYDAETYDNEILQKMVERQNWLKLPVSFSYMFLKGKLQPYVGVGATFGYMLSANQVIDMSYSETAQNPLASTNRNVNLTQQNRRERLNFWYNGLVGVMYKIPQSYICLDISYQINPLQQVNPETRYDNSEDIFETSYVDDDFYLDNLSIGVSYLYCFYNPKKKKHRGGK